MLRVVVLLLLSWTLVLTMARLMFMTAIMNMSTLTVLVVVFMVLKMLLRVIRTQVLRSASKAVQPAVLKECSPKARITSGNPLSYSVFLLLPCMYACIVMTIVAVLIITVNMTTTRAIILYIMITISTIALKCDAET